MEHELLTLSEHTSISTVNSGVHVTQSCVVLYGSMFVLLSFGLVFSVLEVTSSDYPLCFLFFKLSLQITHFVSSNFSFR